MNGLPQNSTLDALRVLQAHGWRMRAPFCLWRRVGANKETLYSPARGGWYLWRTDTPYLVGATLAAAVYRLHGDEMLDAGLGALLLRGAAVEMGAEYAPVMEAVR